MARMAIRVPFTLVILNVAVLAQYPGSFSARPPRPSMGGTGGSNSDSKPGPPTFPFDTDAIKIPTPPFFPAFNFSPSQFLPQGVPLPPSYSSDSKDEALETNKLDSPPSPPKNPGPNPNRPNKPQAKPPAPAVQESKDPVTPAKPQVQAPNSESKKPLPQNSDSKPKPAPGNLATPEESSSLSPESDKKNPADLLLPGLLNSDSKPILGSLSKPQELLSPESSDKKKPLAVLSTSQSSDSKPTPVISSKPQDSLSPSPESSDKKKPLGEVAKPQTLLESKPSSPSPAQESSPQEAKNPAALTPAPSIGWGSVTTTTTTTTPKPSTPSPKPKPPSCDLDALDAHILSLIESPTYRKELRPRQPDNNATLVSVNTNVYNITGVNEAERTWSLHLAVRQYWNDPRLRYDIGACKNYKFFTLTNPQGIWRPGLFFRNGYDGFVHTLMEPNYFLKIYPNGDVMLSTRVQLTLGCDVEGGKRGEFYCTIHIGSYAYSINEVYLKWRDSTPIQYEPDVFTSNDLVLGEVRAISGLGVTAEGKFTYAVGRFQFLRKNTCTYRYDQ